MSMLYSTNPCDRRGQQPNHRCQQQQQQQQQHQQQEQRQQQI